MLSKPYWHINFAAHKIAFVFAVYPVLTWHFFYHHLQIISEICHRELVVSHVLIPLYLPKYWTNILLPRLPQECNVYSKYIINYNIWLCKLHVFCQISVLLTVSVTFLQTYIVNTKKSSTMEVTISVK